MILAALAIVFIVAPLIELYVFVQVGQSIGFLDALGILILVSLFGAWIAHREGLGVIARIRQQLDLGRIPTDDLIDGGLVLFGGILLILPGFVSDAFGLIILFPPTRALLRRPIRRRFAITTVRRYNGRYPGGDDGSGSGGPPVIDV
jgi:UPF0716 protein FxsA